MNVPIVMDGSEYTVGGTSCAAPAVAAILSMLNDLRIARHKPVLGYAFQQLFYQNATAPGFVPISTVRKALFSFPFLSRCKGPANSDNGCQGFQPDVNGGWSPIVGFGGINFATMSTIVKNLP